METSSPECTQTLNGEALIYVPTGSMRNPMLEFLFKQGFEPEKIRPEEWRSQGKEQKYEEVDLGIWRKDKSVIKVIVRERNDIPKIIATETLLQGKPALGLTNSDIVLANILCDSQNPESLFTNGSLTTYDLPISSGRSGGTSRWALVAPREAFEEGTVYRNGKNLRVISENKALAQYFCEQRIGAITKEIAERASMPEVINGKEEERLDELCRKNAEPTILIGVVESGESARKRGFDWREIYRVKAQAVFFAELLKKRPEMVSVIETLCL